MWAGSFGQLKADKFLKDSNIISQQTNNCRVESGERPLGAIDAFNDNINNHCYH